MVPRAGWFADPTGRSLMRYWAGESWSAWVYDGTSVRSEQQPRSRALDLSDFGHLDFVENVFLPEARVRGYLTPAEALRLDGLVKELMTDASHERVPAATAEGTAEITPGRVGAPPAPAPVVTPTVPSLPARPPGTAGQTPSGKAAGIPPRGVAPGPEAHRPPSALALWWGRTREAVASDLAVHGLAYVGVLLFFVGAFGLVVFAFGDVAPALRPVAETVIALAPFGAGWLLRGRGALVVGRALEVAGGLVLPIMLITTLLDGVEFPPDLEGVPLVVALTALTSLVAATYAVWSRRRPDSALRYLVAPVAWLAVAMATVGLGRAIPTGKGVATPSAAQAAAMTAALVVTVAWARLRPVARLAAPTLAVAPPGLVVVVGLSLLSWTAAEWPADAVLASGVLVVLALELLADRLAPILVGILQPMWWTIVSAALWVGASDNLVDVATMAAVSAVGFVAILDVAGAAQRPRPALLLGALGLVMALSTTWADPRWATAAFGATSLWAAGRRMAPFGGRAGAAALDAATAILPATALIAFAAAQSLPSAVLASAALVVLVSHPARLGWLGRRTDDPYWSRWWSAAMVIVGVVALTAWADGPSWTVGEQWFLVSSVGLLSVAAAIGPLAARWRPLVVVGLASATWVLAAAMFDASDLAVVAPLGVAGLALVVAAHLLPTSSRLQPPGLGLAGHALGVATMGMAATAERQLPVADGDWGLVLTTGLATAGWLVSAWFDARGRSVVVDAIAQVGTEGRWVPYVLAAAGLPATSSLALDRAGVLPLDHVWWVIVPMATAVGYAALSRLALPGRVVTVAAWGGFLSGLAAAVLARAALPGAAGLAALVVAVALVRPQRRAPIMVWTAWVAVAPLAGLLSHEYSSWFAGLSADMAWVVALVTAGALLLVGGAAADLRGRPWSPRRSPVHAWALAPVVVGATELLAGLVIATLNASNDVSGWFLAGGAAAVLVTAVLSRAGSLAGVAALIGWGATLVLAGPEIEARPWIAVVAALALLVAAQGLSRPSVGSPWWARWDTPLLVAAAPVAGTALGFASVAPPSTMAATFTLVGAECLAVAARLWRQPVTAFIVGAVGAALVLTGAGVAGPGWLALSLLGLAAVLTAAAGRARGVPRTAMQVGGAIAAVASWRVASDWLALSDQRAVELAALGAGALTAIAAIVALRTAMDRSWLLVWGGAAVVVELVCWWDAVAAVGLFRADVAASWPLAGGLLVVALGLAAGAPAIPVGWLRELAMGFGLASLMVGMRIAEISVAGQVVVVSLLSALTAAATLGLSRGAVISPWRRPLIVLGGLSTLWAVGAAWLAGDSLLLVPAVAAAAVQSAATGVALRSTVLQMVSPVLACTAWLLFSLQALDGNPQWVTVPIGLTTLVVVALWRHDREQHHAPIASTDIVVVELVGVAFLVGAALVQTLTEALSYAVLAMGIGLGIIGWGVVTKVRRRMAAGIVGVLLSLVLLIGVPLVNLLPSWEGAGLWVLIGAVGLAAVLIASMIERGRAALHKGMRRLAEVTSGWE